MTTNQIDSDQAFSGVAQTANLGSSTSVSSGAAKIFREFKWGLLTLFILMTVVVCLVYDGGRGKKKTDAALGKPPVNVDSNLNLAEQPSTSVADNVAGSSSVLTPPAATDHGDARAAHSEERSAVWDVDTNPQTPMHRLGSGSGTNAGDAPPSRLTNGNPTARNRNSGRLPDPANSDGSLGQSGNEAPARTGRLIHAPNDTHETATHGTEHGFKWYTVKAGDNLTRIANANLPGKGGNRAILEANKDTLSDVNKLREGMKIKIPDQIAEAPTTAESLKRDRANSVARDREIAHGDSAPHASIMTKDDYVVQAGDTLERIARRVLNDSRKWKELLEWNNDRISDASKLKVGTVLRTHAACKAAGEVPHPRQNTVRAEAAPSTPENDLQAQPTAEEVPIPVHPVAANSSVINTHNNENLRAPKKDKSSSEPADEDAALRGFIAR